jgi:hypothetical protein
MKLARALLVGGIAAGFASAVLACEEAEVMAVGLAPIAWLAIEAGWRILDPRG